VKSKLQRLRVGRQHLGRQGQPLHWNCGHLARKERISTSAELPIIARSFREGTARRCDADETTHVIIVRTPAPRPVNEADWVTFNSVTHIETAGGAHL